MKKNLSDETNFQKFLKHSPAAIILELILVFLPLYLGLLVSFKMDVHQTTLFGDLALVGGPLAYLGVVISLIILWFFSKQRGAGWDEMGVRNPGKWWVLILKSLGVALAIFGAVVLIINPILNRIPNLVPRDMSRFKILEGNLPNLMINLVAMWITAGFLEELLWRGYLMNRLRGFFKSDSPGTWVTVIVLSSIVFGLGHNYQGLYGILKTGAIGFVFSLAFLATGKTVWPLVLAHALIDSLDFIGHFLGN